MPAPDPASTPALTALLLLQAVIILAACALLVLRVRALPMRFLGLAPSPLGPSPLHGSELFLTFASAFGCAIILQQAAMALAGRWSPAPADGSLGFYHVLVGAGFQVGLLVGLGVARLITLQAAPLPAGPGQPPPAPPGPATPSLARAVRGGVFTFLVAVAVVLPVSLLWGAFLKTFGIEAKPQDLVSLFKNSGDHVSLGLLIGLAVIVAPLSEELLFRVGLFRWLRHRTPRSAALFVPALLFAVIHSYLSVLMPLVALAVVLALGYEHYGHRAVPILAHALFNLNTIALLLAGYSP